ncbi:MAG: hypothetical protein KH009_00030 [Clostridiales bacterium]|nr:hypothetical protein [Clostridiales bacterium]
MKKFRITILFSLLLLVGCIGVFFLDREVVKELREPVTLTFLATDPANPDNVDPDTEIILCAENPSSFTLATDSRGSYDILNEGQRIGQIFLIQDSDGAYFKKCQTLGDNAFVGEITDLSDQIDRECVRNTIFYPADKNTGEPSEILTVFYIIRVNSYSLKIQASKIPIEEADIFFENMLPFFQTVTIQKR